MSAKIEFNEQQQEAIKCAVEWYKGWKTGKHRQQVFFLTGRAGTGKTSVAQTIAELCAPRGKIAYIAPTGKAASRLRQKGCEGARTLHQFCYNILGENDEGEPIFREKAALDERPLLVVCDEVSMLGQRDNNAMIQHGLPVLALGDLGQVPPVKAVAAYSEENVDFELTQIMRQAESSNIVRASMFVREGKRLPLREYDDVRVRSGNPSLNDLNEHIGEESQIICARNDTRKGINNRIRAAMGHNPYSLPVIGEKIICLSNQHDFGFMNGEQMIIESFREPTSGEWDANWVDGMLLVRGKCLSTGKPKTAAFNPLSFSSDYETRVEAQKTCGGFDYGFAITIHKSQGSEWDYVLVIEESFGGDYRKLMYTAFTRAAKRLTVYRY